MLRRFALAAALVASLTRCDHDHPAVASNLYVMNQGEATVSVLDPETGTLIKTIRLSDLGFSATAKPHFAVFESDGSAWYLSLIGENKVVKFNAEDAVVGQVTTSQPGMLALGSGAAAGQLAVSRSLSAVNPPASVAIVNRAAMQVLEERPIPGPHPHALGSADGRFFTASLRQNVLVTLRPDGTSATTPVDGVDQGFAHLAIAPDHQRLAVSADLTGLVHIFRIQTDGSLASEGAVSTGGRPWHSHFSEDGAKLYVPLYQANTVVVVDVATRTVVKTITGNGLANPYTAMLSPDGATLYVSNANLNGAYTASTNGTVVWIDTATDTIARVVEVGRSPTGLAMMGTHH